MNYSNKYEFLNQESRLPLLKILKKYNISPEDKDLIERILWWTYDQYDEASTMAVFFEKKFDCSLKVFKEYMEFYSETHQSPIDYRKLDPVSVYEEGDDYD